MSDKNAAIAGLVAGIKGGYFPSMAAIKRRVTEIVRDAEDATREKDAAIALSFADKTLDNQWSITRAMVATDIAEAITKGKARRKP